MELVVEFDPFVKIKVFACVDMRAKICRFIKDNHIKVDQTILKKILTKDQKI